MSSDNAIYIIELKDKIIVKEMTLGEIDNIFEGSNFIDNFKHAFSNANIYYTIDEAYKRAKALIKELHFVEYGIQSIELFNYKYNDFYK